jgi:hypothetical protein
MHLAVREPPRDPAEHLHAVLEPETHRFELQRKGVILAQSQGTAKQGELQLGLM